MQNFEQAIKETQQLIQRALTGKHEIQKISKFEQFRTAGFLIKSTKHLVNGFKNLFRSLYKEYINAGQIERCDLQEPLTLLQLKTCIEYYGEQIKLLKRARKDYLHRLFDTNIFELIFGEYHD